MRRSSVQQVLVKKLAVFGLHSVEPLIRVHYTTVVTIVGLSDIDY